MVSSNKDFKDAAIRAFIAVRLPDPVIQWLSGIQHQLKQSRIKASWPKPKTLHLTLKFLGDIRSDQVDAIQACMNNAINDLPPFFLHSNGLGCFPSVKRARVLWAGVGGQTDVLESVVRQLDQNLNKAIGMKRDKKRFSPHLTLARIKQPLSPKKVIHLMQDFKNEKSEAFKVESIKLYKSTLTSSGAIHEKLFSTKIG